MSVEQLHPSLGHHVVSTLGWRSLRPLQERAIAPVVAGDHALLSAPTAGGKTEAAVLPLLSRMLTERWWGLSVIYVCPLRALLNDLEPRLARLSSFVGRRADVWHGDVPAARRAAILRDPPDILLTTPESLESMAISRRVDHLALFGEVRAIVVDEVHAFAGDDRGWHLLAVLARLDERLPSRAQRIGLTATVGNPEELLTWLVDDPAPSLGRTVIVAGGATAAAPPELEVDFVGSVDNAARVIHALHVGEKRLVFAESRSTVEEVATALRKLGTTVFVSHSSLSAGERRDAEAAFSAARDCVIVATSTLELGIDVGDLDRVIQIGAPATVASVLQRIGRTGRRDGAARNGLFLATSEGELVRALALVLLIRRGWVEPLEPPPQPMHLLAQQLLARLLEAGRVGRSTWPGPLQRELAPAGLSAAHATAVLDHMIADGHVEEHAGVLSMGEEGERLFGRRHFMDVLSLFLTEPMLGVCHGMRVLGTIDPGALRVRDDAQQPVILLGGHAWTVRETDWDQRVVWVEPSKDPGRSRWSGDGRPLSYEVCQAHRDVLVDGADLEDAMTRRARSALAGFREELDGVPVTGSWLEHDGGRGRARWWTFAGARANAQLASALATAGLKVGGIEELSLSVDPRWRGRAPHPRELDLATVPRIEEARLDGVKFSRAVPRGLLQQMLERRGADDVAVAAVVGAPLHRTERM